MRVEVQHWSGAGNRFVVIDNRTGLVDVSTPLVRRLCQRSNLPQAEGLLVLLGLDGETATCQYDFYNPDGSTGVMCGNGARCAVRHAIGTGQWTKRNVRLILNGCSYEAEAIDVDRVALRLPLFNELRLLDRWSYVNVGSEHIVLDARQFVQSIDAFHRFDLIRFAEEHLDNFRHQVARRSLNLNFAYLSDDTSVIHLRTYENGVFDETQACGTGAVSTAIAFWSRHLLRERKISCMPTSQRVLTVHLEIDETDEKIVGIVLEGDAREDASANQFEIDSMEYRSMLSQ